MYLGLISFNFKKTPLVLREKIKFTVDDYGQVYRLLKKSKILNSNVIVSTCNRTELYYSIDDSINNIDIKEVHQELFNILESVFSIKIKEFKKYAVDKSGNFVIKYLMQVAAGLRSQVLGEEQILGQIKEALQIALNHKASDRYLNKLFQQVITTAKKIRKETGISEKNLSISSLCVNFIERNYQNLNNKKILVIGAGKMSRIVLQLLQERGINKIFVTNRTSDKIEKIKKYFKNVIAVDYNKLAEKAVDVDIIISSTAAPHFVLQGDKFKKKYEYKLTNTGIDIMNENTNIDICNICIFDLGVPRDLDPEIGNLAGIKLYNIDELHEKINKNRQFRLKEADEAMSLIEEGVKNIEEWFKWQAVTPLIKQLKKENQKILEDQLQTFLMKIDIDDELNKKIDYFTEHLEKKLFNRIILNMKELIIENESEELIDLFYKLLL